MIRVRIGVWCICRTPNLNTMTREELAAYAAMLPDSLNAVIGVRMYIQARINLIVVRERGGTTETLMGWADVMYHEYLRGRVKW